MNTSLNTTLVVAGRVLLALMFVLSGFSKLTGVQATAGYIASAGLPAPTFLAIVVGFLEVSAGLALVLGFKTRWAALGLGLFTLAATAVFHAYWSAPAEQQFVQQLLFMKNLAVAGGLFIVTALGADSFGIDAHRDRLPRRA